MDLTYKCLSEYEKEGARFLYNCYLPKGNDQTTEIDLLMLHSSGISELKKIARLPIDCDTWLGIGHTVHSNERMEQIDESTKLNSFMILCGLDNEAQRCELRLKSGKLINFYLLMPLYQEELDYKLNNGYEAFMNLIPDEDLPPIVNPNRTNYAGSTNQ